MFSKDTIRKVKTYYTEWENIIANHTSDKGLELQYIMKTYNSIMKRYVTQNKNGQ